MLELIIHESFPLSDDNKYIDVVVAVAGQCGDYVPAFPVSIHFDFYCRNTYELPHKVSADGHKWIVMALVAAGVLPDRRWKRVKSFVDTFHIDSDNPRAVVQII